MSCHSPPHLINRIPNSFLLFVVRIFPGFEAVSAGLCGAVGLPRLLPRLMLNVPPTPLGLVRPAAVLRLPVVEEVLLSSGLRI